MKVIYNDGGRAEAGFKGHADDCVARAIAIVAGLNYADVYARLAREMGNQRRGKRTGRSPASARNGVSTKRKWFDDYMDELGFMWMPTMQIGSGCKVHLCDGELPMGRLVVSVSKHMVAVIDGVVYDTHDPTRGGTRCVYGYYAWEGP